MKPKELSRPSVSGNDIQPGGVRCWNGFTGCGKTVFGCWWNDAVCIWEAAGYNSATKLCLECSNSEAERYGVVYEDLDFVYSALKIGSAGKFGKVPTREEIYPLLKKMGARHRLRNHSGNSLPIGDRA